MDLQGPCPGGGMITLNAKGWAEYRRLIREEGKRPPEAHARALDNPEHHSRFKQGRKK